MDNMDRVSRGDPVEADLFNRIGANPLTWFRRLKFVEPLMSTVVGNRLTVGIMPFFGSTVIVGKLAQSWFDGEVAADAIKWGWDDSGGGGEFVETEPAEEFRVVSWLGFGSESFNEGDKIIAVRLGNYTSDGKDLYLLIAIACPEDEEEG